MSRFHDQIRSCVEAELDAARRAEELGDAEAAFRRLQRAHVLGQSSTWLPTRVHWLILRWAIRQRCGNEAVGQLFRVLAAATKTVFGWVPHGNTGASLSGRSVRWPFRRNCKG